MTPDSETRKRLREELETLFANKSNCYTEAEDDDGVLEIAAMTSDVFVEVVLPKLIAAEEEIARTEKRGEPASDWKWVSLSTVIDAIKKMQPHTWTRNWDLKYIDVRIDTRDLHCIVKGGGSGEQVTIETINQAIEKANS